MLIEPGEESLSTEIDDFGRRRQFLYTALIKLFKKIAQNAELERHVDEQVL